MAKARKYPSEPVAIIGTGVRLPQADSLDDFWQHLDAGRSLIRELPSGRFDLNAFLSDPAQGNNAKNVWGGFVEDADCFDAAFFGISPKEASFMDPQQRFALEMAWHALEDAGLKASDVAGSNTGVYMGVCHWDYAELLEKHYAHTDAYMPTGIAYSILANRVSHFFDFHGPSITNDTACAASMTSIYEAVRAIQNGECDMALAGGVNLIWSPNHFSAFSKAGMLSKVGKSQAFDAGADGYVRGEGGAVLLLKPLAQAEADGDNIQGIIRGIGVNHGGRTNSLTVTSPDAQAALIQSVYKAADVEIDSINYIEAHGPGTPLGDPIEITGLKQAFSTLYAERGAEIEPDTCGIGSVKTNIGHLEGAAGVAGIIKVLAALKNEKIPANVGFKSLNRMVDLEGTPFHVLGEPRLWKRSDKPRRAGVSSFGFGGSNAHALIEGYDQGGAATGSDGYEGLHYIPLSAKSKERLHSYASALLKHLDRDHSESRNIANIAYTYQTGREDFEERVVFAVKTPQALQVALRDFISGQENADILLAGSEGVEDGTVRDWLSGKSITWAFHADGGVRRISVPVYPFARDVHWMDVFAARKDTAAVPHPLLHRNISTFDHIAFETVLTGDEPIWSDHHVGGVQILPGTVYAEMIHSSVSLMIQAEGKQLTLHDMVILRPVRAEGETVKLETRLKQAGDNTFDVKIIRRDKTGGETLLVQAQVRLSAIQDIAPVDLGQMAEQMPRTIAAEDCYDILLKSGVDHGPLFRVLKQVKSDGQQVLAQLKLSRRMAASHTSLPLHPHLLDGAIQAWVGLDVDLNGQAAVPFACDAVEVYHPCAPEMWVLVRSSAGQQSGGSSLHLDITLFDKKGVVCVQLKNLVLRAMSEKVDTANPLQDTLLSKLTWQEVSLPSVSQPANTHIRLYAAGQVADAAKASAPRLNATYTAFPAPGAQEISETSSQYFSLMHREIASWMRDGATTDADFVLVLEDGFAEVLTAPVTALLKTATLENPKLRALVIRCAKTTASDTLADIIKAEAAIGGGFREVRYGESGTRFLRKFVPSESLPSPKGLKLDPEAVYWVTGGAGGLGQHFTEWLVANGARNILLTGRSPKISEKAQAWLDEYTQAGLNLMYRPCDMTGISDLQATVEWCTKKVGVLKGIIHAAGVLGDGYIFNQDVADIETVFAPKVDGLVHLDRATSGCALEFMVLCSSVAASFGNSGQALYAGANAFMDAFVHDRNQMVGAGTRAGKTVSIAWPLWADGGMQVDGATLTAMQKRWGIKPLPKEIAKAALSTVIAQETAENHTVMYGDMGDITKFLSGFGADQLPSSVAATVDSSKKVSTVAGTADLKKIAIEHLRDVFADVLQFEPEELRVNRKLEEYGLESISIVEATNKLEENFGPLSKTLLFEFVDIQGLAAYFVENHADALMQQSSAPEADTASQTTEQAAQALKVVEDAPVKISSMAKDADDSHDIAIVGMSLKVSKADDQDTFWQMLKDGIDGFETWPKSRWDHDAILHPERDVLGKTVVKTGAFLDDIDKFDPRYFRISQAEAEIMSPEVRLFLEASVHAFEDAGYSREYIQQAYGGDVAVIMGSMTNEYHLYGFQNMLMRGARASGSYTGTVPNMVSYYYGFTGPSYFLDTMCSASSTCVHEAVHMLRAGRCKMALAGGVSLLLHPQKLIATSQEHFTTKTADVIRGYGVGADGTILGEGVGALVLKTLADAERDGDHIYGVIKGTGISNAGVRNGFTVPSPAQQARAIEEALDDAKIEASSIGYIEGHGSGTALGDPIEVRALTQVYGKAGLALQSCPVGTVKSNVAHLLAASGLAGLAKVLMQFKYGAIAPSLHSAELNPDIPFEKTPFYVPQTLLPWKPQINQHGQPLPRRAGVTSIGAGGMNSHIILEEYIDERPATPRRQEDVLLVLSAMNEDALSRVTEQFCAYLVKAADVPLSDIAYTLQVGKNELPCRLAVTARSHEEAIQKIWSYQSGADRVWYVRSILDQDPPEDADYIERAVAGRQLETVADIWTKGVPVNWRHYNEGHSLRRVSLPNYPFERVHCWYQDYPDAPSVINPLGSKSKLHPFVGQNVSDLSGLAYETALYLEEMQDYVCRAGRDMYINPVVAADVAAALGRVAGLSGDIALEALNVHNPADWQSVTALKYNLETDGAGRLHISALVVAGDKEAVWFEAEIKGQAVPLHQPLDLKSLIASSFEKIEHASLYSEFSKRRLGYGPYLETIESVYKLQDGRYLAQIRNNPPQQDSFKKNMQLDAVALAAANQLFEYVSPGWGAGLQWSLSRAYVAANDITYVLLSPNVQSSYDVAFLTETGLICASFEGVCEGQNILRTASGVEHSLSTETTTELVAQSLKEIAGGILKFPTADIPDRERFHDLGFDSITLTQYAEEINKALAVDISPAIFFDCADIKALSQHLVTRFNPVVGETVKHQPAPAPKVVQEKTQPLANKVHTVAEKRRADDSGDDEIAIIGMAGRFPGADTVDALFARLVAGEDLISDLPLERYEGQLLSHITEADFVKRGGFIGGVDLFDASYFKISPFEAQRLDPQQRLMLETVIHSLDDAGYDKTELPKDTGVFIGVSALDYEALLKASGNKADGYSATGNSLAMVANRVSHFLDIYGPSMSIDTACSSSLVALHQAASAIKQGSCPVAIVGGVNLCLSKDGFEGPLDAGMLSPTGYCHSFGDSADGYVRGEGVAAVILKKYSEAVRDGDNIYGKIIGTAQNHGGHAGSLTAPNVQAQSQLVQTAMQGIDPATISYIEAHGTGTQLGDAVEVSALKQAFETQLGSQKYDAPFVHLGSIKSNIGHLEAAAGLAGVVKVLLAMQHKTLPKSLHCETVNPHLGLGGSPFKLVTETRAWESSADAPRRAGVSSFGFGGGNAHVVLEQAPDSYVATRAKRQATVFNRKSYWLPDADGVTQRPTILTPEWVEKPLSIGALPQDMRRVVLPVNMEVAFTQNAVQHPFQSHNSDVAEKYAGAVKHVWRHLKALIEDQSETQTLVQLLVPDMSEADGYLAGLSAMLETAAIEAPKLQVQYIQSDRRYAPQALADLLENEFASSDKSIRYHAGRRYAQAWTQTSLNVSHSQTLSGVTLITGGLGGVGQGVAAHIAEQTSASALILTGRSELTHDDEAFLAALQAQGVQVDYVRTDIADEHAVQELVTHIIRKYGQLNHIMHCAGVLRDGYIIQKPETDLDITLSAKVVGTVALANATKAMNLDSFVLFSSLAGITGNEGQIDYAAANGFMDAFAASSDGRILSVNWPYWLSGGMVMDQLSQDRLYEQMGQRPMSTKQGLDALKVLACFGQSRAAVIAGEPDKIKHYFAGLMQRNKVALSSDVKVTAHSNAHQKTALIPAVRKHLTSLFAKVSGVDAYDIDGDVLLEEYGIDSLMITRLNRELADIFGALSKTLFFQYKTLNAVADYLVQGKASECEKWVGYVLDSASAIPQADMAPQTAQNPSRFAPKDADAGDAVAIIGISGQYAGGDGLKGFWETLVSDRNVISEIPEDRWPLAGFFESDPDKAIEAGKSYAKWGSFLTGFADFDPLFFKISPRDAAAMDPQERLFLASSWHAMENAGYSPERLKDQTQGQVGVFAGVCKTGYALHGPYESEDGAIVRPATSFASVANRVSHVLDLSGPSMPVDTMCSSSLTAIHEACAYLQKNPHAMAFAGGVNLYLHPSNYTELCAAGMLSPDGLCKSFGAGANGFVPGEGVGCILLKPLSKALADGDYIHAVIRGSAVNHGGHTNGYTVPNPQAQRDVVRMALDAAGVRAEQLSYIEAHGTGTSLGDPIEVEGLTQAFDRDTDSKGFCALGSVKSVFGHLEAAAGIAGLTKVVLQMQQGQLVPTRHVDKVNPNIEFDMTPFKLQRTLEPWGNDTPKIAGISSFGAGGANAHIIIEEAPKSAFTRPSHKTDFEEVIILSAKSRTGLAAQAKQLLDFLGDQSTGSAAVDKVAIIEALLSELSNILKVDKSDLQVDDPLDTLGMEPHHWIMLERWLNHTYDHSIQETSLSAQSSLLDIAASMGASDIPADKRTNASLADIAYTLQVGRQDMECRLAFTARTIGELTDKLGRWLSGDRTDSQIFESEDKPVAAAMKKLLGGDALDSIVSGYWQQKDYDKLLPIWVAGISVDWLALPRACKAKTVPLPTYPFDLQKYWLPRLAGSSAYKGLVTEIAAASGDTVLQDADDRLEARIAVLLKAILADIRPDAITDGYKAWYKAALQLVADDSDTKPFEKAWNDWNTYMPVSAVNLSRIELAEIAFRHLPAVLTGQKKATDVLFPDGSLKAVEAVYKENPIAARFSKHTANGVAAFVRDRVKTAPQQKIKILEIGAGTGGTSKLIFEELMPYADHIDSYCYTDVSRAFLIHAEQQYLSDVSYLKTAILDIEKPTISDEVGAADYDLVVAANVLHATADIVSTLKNVRKMLKPDGVLLLNETSKATLFTHLTFGLLDGWWRFTDAERRIAGTPSLTSASWDAALQEAGFEGISYSGTKEQALGQQIIAARAVGEVVNLPISTAVQTVEKPAPKPEAPSYGSSVESVLKVSLARTLNMPVAKITAGQAFADLGLDSILGAEWVRRIRSDLGIKLDQTALYDFTNLKELTIFVEETWPEACQKTDVQQPSQSIAEATETGPKKTERVEKEAFSTIGMPSKAQQQREPIAIVGMSGRFAGSETIAELWDHLFAGDDLVQPVSRFDLSAYYKDAPKGTYGDKGSFLSRIDTFDSVFFGISGVEATYMDPQQRLFLEEAWKTLEHAGHAGGDIIGSECGVFVGCSHGDYHELFGGDAPGQAFWGNTSSLIPARISYWLDLKGPAVAIDTACSSSLVAVHTACRSIWDGECNMALAGGVFVQSGPRFYRSANQAQMLSPSGNCAAFGEMADGIVPGEAVASVLLRPLSEALADGDTVYGVIIGSGTNQDGATNGITAPSAKSQEKLIRKVQTEYNIDPASIGMVEAHGTGTPLGDPIEFNALNRVFGHRASNGKSIYLGSVKSNIGHATTAAGICGLIRGVMSLHHKMVPPTLHAAKPNPSIAIEDSPFVLNDKPEAWTVENGQKRRFAINSFGFSGTNAHLVVEEPPVDDSVSTDELGPYLFVFSARTPDQLRLQVENCVRCFEADTALKAKDVAYTLMAGRRHFNHRLAVVAGTIDILVQKLSAWLQDSLDDHVLSSVYDPQENQSKADDSLTAQHLIEGVRTSVEQAEDSLKQLAGLYLRGANMPIKDLFLSGFKRVALPTYPLVSKSFWAGELPFEITASEVDVPALPTMKSADGKVTLIDPAKVRSARSYGVPVKVSLAPLRTTAPSDNAGSIMPLATEKYDGIFVARFGVGNCIDLTAFERAIAEAESQQDISAVVVQGLEHCQSVLGPKQKTALLGICKLPVVVVIEEDAVTAGLSLALNADFLVIADGVSISFDSENAQVDAGVLSRRFSKAALQMLSHSKDAVSLQKLTEAGAGFITASASDVVDRAMSLAKQITEAPRISIEALKHHMRRTLPALSYEDSQSREGLLRGMLEQSGQQAEAFPIKDETILLKTDLMYLTKSSDGVLTLQMKDAESSNSFTSSFMDGFEEAFDTVARQSDAKVLVLTGFDSYFAVGGTADGLQKLQEGATSFTDRKVYSLPLECELPVIAAMQGHAVGAGWSMGMTADLVLFANERVYHSNYMWFGFTPGAGATLALPLRLGDDLAREVLFSAREYRGADLKARAPWLKVLPAKDVYNEAKRMAHALVHFTRAELIAAKKQQSQYHRNAISRVFEQELAMHQTTFIGNKRVEERIAEKFAESAGETLEPSQKLTGSMSVDVRRHVLESLAKELMISADEVREDMSFLDLGMDSILAVTWIRSLNEALNTDLPATTVYSSPTVGVMIQKLEGLLPEVSVAEVGEESSQHRNKAEKPAQQSTGLDVDLRQTIVSSLSEELMIDESEIRGDVSFLELGLDSILAVTWIRRLNALLGIDLPATVVYSCPNIEKVLETVAKAMPEKVVAEPVAVKSVCVPEVTEPAQTAPKVQAVQTVPAPVSKKDVSASGIAIIGASGAFPKSTTLDEFWQNLRDGVNCITTVQPDRFDVETYYHPDQAHPGTTYCKWVGRLDHVDEFDPAFFNITPREATLMDPQQRLFLKHAWHAIENAAIDPLSMAGQKCGVYASAGDSGYGNLIQEKNAYSLSGNSGSILASRISYFLDLRGPSLAIDTACSSSLVGIIEACDALATRRCDTALVGGVSVMIGPDMFIDTSKVSMLSKTGQCYTFDQRADGFVPGEGVGVVMLKRLDDAVRDGDPIRAVIKGWGTNQDGRTNGITAPNPDAQAALMRDVYDRFDIDPATIGLVECHGTGTPLGDPIEVEGLTEAFASVKKHEKSCQLGSVKSNVGHLLAAAGVAGALKGMLALEHKQKPPLIHFKNCNEHIDFSKTPFDVNTDLIDWTAQPDVPRRVAVSSFGFSGTNAHIVMEEAPVKQSSGAVAQPFLFTLSAKTPDQLQVAIDDISRFVERESGLGLASFAYSLQVGRSDFKHRLAFVYQSRDDLLDSLSRAMGGKQHDDIYRTGAGGDNKALFDSDSGMAALAETWLKSDDASDLHKLGKMWVEGLQVNWRAAPKTARMATPGYPFERKRYWVKAREKAAVVSSVKEKPAQMPAHRDSIENLSVPVFLNGHSSTIMSFPEVQADYMPPLLLSELAREALQQTSGTRVAGLKHLMWGNPVPFKDHESALNIVISEDDAGRLFRVVSGGDQASPYHLAEEMADHELPAHPTEITKNKAGEDIRTELLDFMAPDAWSSRGLAVISARKHEKSISLHLKRAPHTASAGLFDVQFLSIVTAVGAFVETVVNGEDLQAQSLSLFSLENLVSYGLLDDEMWLEVTPGSLSEGYPASMVFYGTDRKARLLLKNLHMVPAGASTPIMLNS
ncbi:SDR family NAD(P)-dependent oxidoreductase [Kordiimonas pumila]|uniref:SDR family NAD(P)-dependent oxidoreductase n=1 Tax=Kordiimonas pumila TaxID=2161677 RepID=A0ABV7D304_9PROT|nr:SDR family NAD(P)-dependent oxidoreductase [Kordiimonas pumila]